jgi:pilus assembly protein Flp/PilA
MRIMPRLLRQFLADQSGATSIEYALIAAGIALAIIAAVNSLGTTLSKKFTSINSSLK